MTTGRGLGRLFQRRPAFVFMLAGMKEGVGYQGAKGYRDAGHASFMTRLLLMLRQHLHPLLL